jgi:phosphoenolpyruvate phosphomutase
LKIEDLGKMSKSPSKTVDLGCGQHSLDSLSTASFSNPSPVVAPDRPQAAQPPKIKKTTRFKQLLHSCELAFICEAHSGLSAKIVQESGFDGIWASGLTISAQLGVRDSNEASWTQVLELLEFMSDATMIPIMLDGDTGYGNFNNVQRLVKKLEQRSIAAVCIEDKHFPKTNSFIDGSQQPLANIDEFVGKIKAGKDAQSDPDFCLVARIEAFIAGWGLAEALRRAEAYHRAGADAILIHSAKALPDEILTFKREWGNRCPVVIVPTKYYSTPTAVFREHGFAMVIWANQLLRSAVKAMQQVAAEIHDRESLTRVEDKIASMEDIFRLQGTEDLQLAEKRYLPRRSAMPTVVVLAAARGKELEELTINRPKAMVQIGNMPLLAHIISVYNGAGLKDIVVVRGYKKEAIDLPNVAYADNDDYESAGELHSLFKGISSCRTTEHGLIVSYGDVLFRKHVLDLLLETAGDIVIIVDTEWRDSVNRDRVADYVRCSLPYSRRHYNRKVTLQQIGAGLSPDEIHGESMGFLKVAPAAVPIVQDVLKSLLSAPAMRSANMPVLLNELVAHGHPVRVIYTSGNWCDIDSIEDVTNAAVF